MSFIFSSLSKTKFASTALSGHALAPTPLNIWIRRVSNNGGTMAVDSISIATDLMAQLEAASYYSKIIYLLPLLGSNFAAAQVPLIDVVNAGIPVNHNFNNGDFSQATGLQGDGSTKILDTNIKPSQLGISSNGGMGWWEGNWSGSSNSEPIGCYNSGSSQRYVLDLRSSVWFFPWGAPGNNAAEATSAGNHHYYGNRSSSTDRRIFKDGALIQTNSTSDTASGVGDTNIAIMGSYEPSSTPYQGRCKVAYLTDGTLSDADAAAFHTLLDTYLITPTGR